MYFTHFKSNPGSPLKRSGFTLVEMLTVLAIIATLATLLFSALSGAKRKSRQALCLSNLRQYSLALNMYLDDERKRPDHISKLVKSKYLANPNALICPEDRWGGWGNRVNDLQFGPFVNEEVAAVSYAPYSYLNPLKWEDWAWRIILNSQSNGSVGVCQLHGIGRPDPDFPSINDFRGLTLRAHLDASVTRGMVYSNELGVDTSGRWGEDDLSAGAPPEPTSGMDGSPVQNGNYPWGLFMDQPEAVQINPAP